MNCLVLQATSPKSDLRATGALTQLDNNRPVFFMGGGANGYGPATSITVTVPIGRPVLLRLVNLIDFESDAFYAPGTPLAGRQAVATAVADGYEAAVSPSALSATIDGTVVADPYQYRARAPDFFAFGPIASRSFAESAGFPAGVDVGPSVATGWYLMLEGLSLGRHSLSLHGGTTPLDVTTAGATFSIDGFSVDQTITLNVAAVPEPASWALLLTGFGFTGALMRRLSTNVLLPDDFRSAPSTITWAVPIVVWSDGTAASNNRRSVAKGPVAAWPLYGGECGKAAVRWRSRLPTATDPIADIAFRCEHVEMKFLLPVVLLAIGAAPVDHPHSYLLSIERVSLKNTESIEAFSVETWGVEFRAICSIPGGWRIKAGGSATPEGELEGRGSHGATWFHSGSPRELRNFVLVTLYAPVPRAAIGTPDNGVPATFKGTATISTGAHRVLSYRNISLTPTRRCPLH